MCERNKKFCQEVTKNQDKYNSIVDYINKNETNSYNTEHVIITIVEGCINHFYYFLIS